MSFLVPLQLLVDGLVEPRPEGNAHPEGCGPTPLPQVRVEPRLRVLLLIVHCPSFVLGSLPSLAKP